MRRTTAGECPASDHFPMGPVPIFMVAVAHRTVVLRVDLGEEVSDVGIAFDG